jgi:hypothetical protein
MERIESEAWPALPYDQWADTCATLQLWSQVIGKIRLAKAPMINHWWQVPLYVTARGLTTSPMPDGNRRFQIDFDFIDHRLVFTSSDGKTDDFALAPCTVADFYREVMARLRGLGIDVRISTLPVEIPDPIPFEADREHASYDAAAAHAFWRALLQVDRVFTAFRARFIGKVSPVHFFWGSFDLAVTRFSGRPAPPHPGAPNIALSVAREAYSHEVSSLGFWPGNGGFGQAAFYAYAYPQPPGFPDAKPRPEAARFDPTLGEFILLYDDVRRAPSPNEAILDFAQSTYEAAAELGGWDRPAFERTMPVRRV